MKKRYYEIILGGSGGQGLVFISSFMARAAMEDGLNTVQTQSYGIAQRGGYISAEVLISDEEILFQQVVRPDIVIVLHEAVGRRFDQLEAPVVYDSGLVGGPKGPNWYGLPFSELARAAGAPRAGNLAAFGAALHFVPLAGLEAVEAAARKNFSPEAAELNLKALRRGLSEAATMFPAGGRS